MNGKLIVYTDGGARGNPGPAGIGAVIKNPQGLTIATFKRAIGEATNNVAEYRALLLGLSEAARLGAAEVAVHMDSELVVRQMLGRYKIKEPALKVLAGDVLQLVKRFSQVSFTHVPREQNRDADRLVNEAIDGSLA